MGIIHYWSDYVKKYRDYIKTDKYIVAFDVKDLDLKKDYNKYFFFKKREEVIKFLKYVVLPSFIYNKLDITHEEDKIIVQDYKDVLNFFVSNEINNSKEIIKRYSFFYNSLEEFEYEKNNVGEETFLNLIETINFYFDNDKLKKSKVNVYSGTEELLDSISNNNDEYFSEKFRQIIGAKSEDELKMFLADNKNNEAIINFIIDMTSEIHNGENIIIEV